MTSVWVGIRAPMISEEADLEEQRHFVSKQQRTRLLSPTTHTIWTKYFSSLDLDITLRALLVIDMLPV